MKIKTPEKQPRSTSVDPESPNGKFEKEHPLYFLSDPSTVLGLLFTVSIVIYYAFIEDQASLSQFDLFRRGIFVSSIIFLVYCSVQLRDNLLEYPHKALWRVFHGIAILYFFCCIVIVIQPVSLARRNLSIFDPALTGERPEENDKVFATDCRVFTPDDPLNRPFARLQESIDIFFYSHLLGWMAKALLLRDWYLAWCLSILWELIEYSLQSILNNLQECWWDHFLLDVFGANLVGMIVGMKIGDWFGMRMYNWTDLAVTKPKEKDSTWLPQLEFFRKPKHFLFALLFIILIEVIEVNAFALKYVLHVPTSSVLNLVRLLVYFSLSLPAVREYYSYATDATVVRLGPNIWLTIATVIVELAIVFKFSKETTFPDGSTNVPMDVQLAWGIMAASILLWGVAKFYIPKRMHEIRHFLLYSLVLVIVGCVLYIPYKMDVGLGATQHY
jgi:phosphatidylserine synthase 2